MAIRTDAAAIQEEYEKGVEYNAELDLYGTVKLNENFYIGKQWEGVSAPDLDKPVLNLLHRVVSYFIAMIVSDDIASQLETDENGTGEAIEIISREIDKIIEDEKIKSKNRVCVRNAAVDGGCCLYLWFDPDAETGQAAKGTVRALVVDNTNVLFGNPQDGSVQDQPYIILPMRELVEDLRREARNNGVSLGEADGIQSDEDPNTYMREYSQDNLATALIKLWKDPDTGTVWATKVCGNVVIREPWDTEYRLYPVAFMPWEAVKNSYHGASAITGLVPNQIFINKLYAMAMHYIKSMAFPKVAYDKSFLPNGISNKVGEAIAVQGDPSKAIFRPMVNADMSNQVFIILDRIIDHTKEFMGATDVALGNVRPENTSAIIAVTKASTIPLDMQRLNFYQFVEDYIRIMLEIMGTDYGRRIVHTMDDRGRDAAKRFDFGVIKQLKFKLNIDVGMSSYWDEITQVQTMDNLFKTGIITDPIDYLEGIPDHFIKNKNRLIAKLEELKAAAQGPSAGAIPPDAAAGQPAPAAAQQTIPVQTAGQPSPQELQAMAAQMQGGR